MGSNPTISTKNSECFATGGKGQSGDVGYGVADYGCAVFFFMPLSADSQGKCSGS
ncbi:MAG: hypothetical protein ACI3XN_01415 [Eubacteriales bacterium]